MNSKNENLAMLCDFYEFTMGNGYLKNNLHKKNVYFDVFFRNIPDDGGFAIAAGLQQVIEYIKDLHFDKEDIEYFRSKNMFSEDFLEYLADFKSTGDIYAVPEGTCIFPREPIMTIKAPAIEAQILETFILLTLNHQSLIATKANRIVRAAQGRPVLEFGSRRAQGADGAVKVLELHILAVALEQLAHLLMNFIKCQLVVLWLMLGYRCLILNMKHLKLIVKFILIMQYY